MLPDSSTGGYVTPAQTPAPLEDENLENFFQAIFVGITGLNGQVVFPRWQESPPNLPEYGTDWAALGITSRIADTYAAFVHDGAGEGTDQMQRHETINLLCSAYGPNSGRTMGSFRDGLQVAQNRDALIAGGMGQVDTGDLVSAPEMFKDRWLRRIDMRWTVRRAIWRTYPILNLLSAQGFIKTVDLTVKFNA